MHYEELQQFTRLFIRYSAIGSYIGCVVTAEAKACRDGLQEDHPSHLGSIMIYGGEVQMELVVKMDDRVEATGAKAFVSEKAGRANAVAFDHAELRAGPTLGHGLHLVVSGPAPKNGAQVILVPSLEQHNPEYRQIEIVAEQRTRFADHGLAPVADSYEKSIPLSGLAGTKGIELIGANGTQKFSLTGGASS